MDVLILTRFLLLIIQLITYSNPIDYDDGCYLDEPPSLQVAFVMDRTATFILGENSFFKQFAALAPKLMGEIDKEYPGTQFALTVHADWQYAAKPPTLGSSIHNQTEGCYNLVTTFTTDRNRFQENIAGNKIKWLGNGEQENGLSALAFTAADAKLGWVRNSTFTNGKIVRRVLILVTDEDDLLYLGEPNKPRPRHEFKGDGTDMCITSKPPTHEKLREVFEKYQMTVITLLAQNKERRNLTKLYEEHFKKIGGSIKYCTRKFVILNGRSLWTDSELIETESKGFWSGENNLQGRGEELGEENFHPFKVGEIAELSEKLAKAGKYDDLITHVKDCLKETDTKACVFGDPEGFNTLGF